MPLPDAPGRPPRRPPVRERLELPPGVEALRPVKGLELATLKLAEPAREALRRWAEQLAAARGAALSSRRVAAASARLPPGVLLGGTAAARLRAARAVAQALRLPLWRVDLSQTSDRYLGETEKNLSRLLEAADRFDVVLLFDEADALFGKRTEPARASATDPDVSSAAVLSALLMRGARTIPLLLSLQQPSAELRKRLGPKATWLDIAAHEAPTVPPSPSATPARRPALGARRSSDTAASTRPDDAPVRAPVRALAAAGPGPGPSAQPAPAKLLATLRSREAELHHPGQHCSRRRLEALLHPAFHETGRSGRPYDRPTVIAALLADQPAGPPVEAFEHAAWLLAPDVALLTFRSRQVLGDGRFGHAARRVSVWLRGSQGWQLFHHQGTPDPD
ncbi:MAG: DUF4440 domain-containing protein [Rubrivivax sp.]|nr:DUF4440 domain-containing protein [Rubrivivax sp.]